MAQVRDKMFFTVYYLTSTFNYVLAETTLISTYHLVTSQDLHEKTIPIGHPLLNYQCLILDKFLQIALSGELYIGGVGVFVGYYGCLDLTQQVLIDIPGKGKFYKTGDLVKLDSNGNIQFLGRVDFQIKLRGQRVETEEIEHVILQQQSLLLNVSNCAVIKVNDDRTKEDHLVAYVQLTSTQERSLTEICLKDYCQRRLPFYMIPSTFVILDQLPLNANGKIVRQQLPKPYFKKSNEKEEMIEPKTKIEITLHGIWCKTFNVGSISMNTNVFAIGGDSLTLMKLYNYYHLQLPLIKKLHISQLFNKPTLNEHVKLLSELQQHDNVTNTVRKQWQTLNIFEGNVSNLSYLKSVRHIK
jgi:hypothetical protein